LWIKIDKENAMAKLRQRRTEINGRGRFADTAFLVRKRNDSHLAKGARPSRLSHRQDVSAPSSDDVAAGPKRKLNFSDFGF
jgi:hypothetical protein